jgi:hypothetical protein
MLPTLGIWTSDAYILFRHLMIDVATLKLKRYVNHPADIYDASIHLDIQALSLTIADACMQFNREHNRGAMNIHSTLYMLSVWLCITKPSSP